MEVDHESVGAAHLESQTLERLLEPQIVEHARAKPPRHALNAQQGGRHEPAQRARRLQRLAELLRLLDGPQADQERRQGLGGVVVQLAGDASSLRLLRGEQSFNSARMVSSAYLRSVMSRLTLT